MPYISKGFSVTEITATLVTLGLLISAVLLGRTILYESHLRLTLVKINKYRDAYNTFLLQYKAPPGDIENANLFWPDNRFITNGNHDGWIGLKKITEAESYSAFLHLYASGLSSDRLAGFEGSGTIPGINVPKLAYNAHTTLYFFSDIIQAVFPRANSLVTSGITQEGWNDPALSLKDIIYFDKKQDDGRPYGGTIIAYSPGNTSCATSPLTGSTLEQRAQATYPATTSSPTYCTMHMMLENHPF